ncbi:hypothetical protein B0I35DRAFT_465579, partial [Stachybotrys elegans]
MASLFPVLLLLWSCLLPLSWAVPSNIHINPGWIMSHRVENSPTIIDCTADQIQVVDQAFADAMRLAEAGARTLIFIDNTVTPALAPEMSYTQNLLWLLSQLHGLPQHITIHCNTAWIDRLNQLFGGNVYLPPNTCDGLTRAFTTRIEIIGEDAAFRTGPHIMLCQGFFDQVQLEDIPDVVRGRTRITDQSKNKGFILLHEMLHAVHPQILGAY